MQLPQRFSYNPKWHVLLFSAVLFGGGAFFFVYMTTHQEEGLSSIPVILGPTGAASFYWIAAAISAVLALLTLLVIVRRLLVSQYLELRHDELVLPRGWFHTRHIRLPYAQIERIWETKISGQSLLFVAVGSRQFKINDSLLPDKAVYATVRDFLLTRHGH
jgi:hypothetical protein